MIKSVYILTHENEPSIIYKNDNSNTEKENSQEEIMRITNTLKQFAEDINEELNQFQIGNTIYYFSEDERSKTKFIIVTNNNLKEDLIRYIFRNIKNNYISHFLGSEVMSEEEIRKAQKMVKNKIASILELNAKNTEEFLLTID
jgi:hypothetical protein